MRPLNVALVALAFVACATESKQEAAREEAPVAAPPAPALTPKFVRTYSETIGDAKGGGLDLGDTRVAIDDDGVLAIDVDIPDAQRSEYVATDNVQVYLDVDLDYERTGYDVRLVLDGNASKPFAIDRYEREKWRDRTPASYEASFDRGLHIRVPAADVGIREDGTFDLFVASIDEKTGLVSDLAPDGALAERYTYTR